MALLFNIAVIIVIIGCILLLLALAKHGIKWLLIALVIIVIASVVFGVNVFSDIKDLQEHFPKAQKLLLLEDNNMILTGFAGRLFSSEDVLSYVSKEQLAVIQQQYNARDIQRIRDDYFKVVIFDTVSFEQLGTISMDGKTMQANDVLDIIRASDTLDRAVAYTIRENDLPNTPQTKNFLKKDFQSKGISTDADMRAFLFASLFAAAMKNPLFLIIEFKRNNIIVYPETITFKLAKIIPNDVLKGALDKLVNT